MRASALQSHAQKLHRQKCNVLTSYTLLVTKRIPMIGEPVPTTTSATAKTSSTIVDLSETYIAWMLKFAGAFA